MFQRGSGFLLNGLQIPSLMQCLKRFPRPLIVDPQAGILDKGKAAIERMKGKCPQFLPEGQSKTGILKRVHVVPPRRVMKESYHEGSDKGKSTYTGSV